jgi:parallel beta-helix repeat protein
VKRKEGFKGILLLTLIISVVLIISQVPRGQAWGWDTHEFIENEAERVFSDNSFFSNNHNTLYTWCIMPDQVPNFMPDGSGAQDWHWLDAYSYDPLPYQGQYGGELPWAMQWIFDNIVQYLKVGDWVNAVDLMGAICHFTGDSTMPLHSTWHASPNGEHVPFEDTVNDHLGEISIPDNYVPQQLDNITAAALASLAKSFSYTAEGANPDDNNLTAFLENGILWNDWIKSMTENRLRAAVQFTANVWYTAMIHAELTIDAPTLTSPSNGSTTADRTPTFTWNSISGTNSYDFQLASDNDFTSETLTAKDLSTTAYTLVEPLTDGEWYWRVRAGDNSTDVGLWSQIQSFTVLIPHHDPIYIDGNSQFTSANGVTGGSGTENDPYTIENWDISAENANGIEIRNTTVYFVVRNCYVYDGRNNCNVGIWLDNVVNGKIENSYFENNDHAGVGFVNSDNNVIKNCITKNNYVHGIVFYDSDNNTVANCVAQYNNDKGIVLVRSQNSHIENCLSINNWAGIQLEDSSNNNVVENCIGEGNRGSGIFVGNSDNNLLKNCIISNSGSNGIQLDYSHNNLINNCTFRSNYGGIALSNSSSNNKIDNNLVENNGPWSGIYLGDSDNNLIENCTASNNNGDGINLENSDNNLILNNTCKNNQEGIYLSNSSNDNLRNNILSNNVYNFHVWGGQISEFYHDVDNSNKVDGKLIYYIVEQENLTFDGDVTSIGFLAMVSCENIRAVNLNIGSNAVGILPVNTSYSMIENCTVQNARWGIEFAFSSNNNIVRNCITEGNSEVGIVLYYSDNNTVEYCTARYNGTGIWINSLNNVIENCTIRNNTWYGISIDSSENNHIYHNNMINNTTQAYDTGSNYWDDGYPSGGDYWSDYVGVDGNNGENQNISGGDGIGDTPYAISGGSNQDRYPLMTPVGGGLILYSPIYIGSSDDFTPANGVVGGSGTESDPYIIENWNISASTAIGIQINNTTAYFIVRNCYVHDGGETYQGIYFYNVTNGKIENDASENNSEGIYLESSGNNTILGSTCSNNYYFGISLYFSSNNTISNNIAENTRNILGIFLNNSDNNLIENNTVRNNQNSGIQIYLSSNNTISNNIVENSRTGEGILIQNSEYNLIENNTCSNNSTYGINLYQSSNNLINNNLVENNYYQGILLSDSSNNTISNNIVEKTQEECGIFLYDSDNNLIENNTVGNSGIIGIYLRTYSNNNILTNNTCNNNGGGIQFYESSNNNLIENNTCSNNSSTGIELDSYSNNNTISGNICSNNYYEGITLYQSSNNLIDNNIVENNNTRGIYLYNSNSDRISNNTIEGNPRGIALSYSGNSSISNNQVAGNTIWGIYIVNSSNNRIFHNNLLNNQTQAYDTGSNCWDDGYPSGGNYWSDYTGMDYNLGPNQDMPGPDGIGDSPYNISGGSDRDCYPLMNPWPYTRVVVNLAISPSYQGGMPETTLTYTVTVKNFGTENDSYNLSISDNAVPSWGPTLDNYALGPIPPGENRTTTLRVTTPESATPNISDNITVTVTSQENENVIDNATCIAVARPNLVAGWNLMSFRKVWENDTPDNLFAGQTYYIWRWDAVNRKYVSPSPTAPVELGVGYWIWVAYDQTVTTSGVLVENYSIDLKNGWNLVGHPVTSPNTTPDNLFAGQTYYIWRWDAVNRKYVSPLSTAPVELGVGYWIWVDHDQTVNVPR